MSALAEAGGVPAVPEIGPSLGRLTDPPNPHATGPLGVVLDDLRVELVSRLFELAGASRQFAEAGDREGAVQSLGRAAWLGVWEQTVATAAARVADAVNAGFEAAAAESRLPTRRRRGLLLTADDTRIITAHLGGGAADFVAALDALDALEPAAAAAAGPPSGRAPATWRAWQDAVGAAARRLESAWLTLAGRAAAEQARWHVEIEQVRAWRRPAWPLWSMTAATLAAATYLGLVLGGYFPVPAPLRSLAEFVWGRLWI